MHRGNRSRDRHRHDERSSLALGTGASSGLGSELAKQFASHGFEPVAVAESDRLDRAVEELRALGSNTQSSSTATGWNDTKIGERLQGRPGRLSARPACSRKLATSTSEIP
jgi:NAD(P)-dependent dehydrogenase (short-subunit alcohol dehydrogenase family)